MYLGLGVEISRMILIQGGKCLSEMESSFLLHRKPVQLSKTP